MPRNIEIKARVDHLRAVRVAAASLASGPPLRLEQLDTFFEVPHGRLKIRDFGGGRGELISYDRPDETGPKSSDYRRASCSEPAALVDALRLVLPLRGEVRKRREVFMVGRTRVHLDEVDGLGFFVELEVMLADAEPPEAGERDARALMEALGLPETSLVSGAYIDLLPPAVE